jgi:hypothetical protein
MHVVTPAMNRHETDACLERSFFLNLILLETAQGYQILQVWCRLSGGLKLISKPPNQNRLHGFLGIYIKAGSKWLMRFQPYHCIT